MTDLSKPGATRQSAGARFRAALAAEKPLQIVGAINAYHARLAERSGFKAIYLSGGGVAAGSLGLPDLGISTLDDVLTDVRRITDACDLPLLVDIDTGFGGAFNIARTVKSLIKFGAGLDTGNGALDGRLQPFDRERIGARDDDKIRIGFGIGRSLDAINQDRKSVV